MTIGVMFSIQSAMACSSRSDCSNSALGAGLLEMLPHAGLHLRIIVEPRQLALDQLDRLLLERVGVAHAGREDRSEPVHVAGPAAGCRGGLHRGLRSRGSLEPTPRRTSMFPGCPRVEHDPVVSDGSFRSERDHSTTIRWPGPEPPQPPRRPQVRPRRPLRWRAPVPPACRASPAWPPRRSRPNRPAVRRSRSPG